jgi:Trehalose-6-phosphate synthase
MIVVSHRGPVSFRHEVDGTFTPRRGAGGVVSALAPLLSDREDTRWIAAAIGDDDRAAVAADAVATPGLTVELLAFDPELHRLHYDVMSNRILWFSFHGLFDLPHAPTFDRAMHTAWDAYRTVNQAFAESIAARATPGEVVLVQDLQLMLVPAFLRELRPDVSISHFTHTPFCGPMELRVLPDPIAHELCASLADTPSGFHTERWAEAFRRCARDVLGRDAPDTFTASFGPDPADLAAASATPAAADSLRALESQIGDRRCIVRADRVELSKNIGRGFLAFDELLESHPEWRDRVTFVAMLNPSRESIVDYRNYRTEVEAIAARVNARWATDDWQPIIVDTRDNFPRSVAALGRADVILVNPVRDGLNLVAMEGPLLNERDAVLCLSREAGAFELLRDHCLEVHPFDVSQTADALHTALAMAPAERAARSDGLRTAVRSRPADAWLAEIVNRAQ